MISKLDKEIKVLLKEIESKRKLLGDKPVEKFNYPSCVAFGYNIRTLTTESLTLEAMATLLGKEHFLRLASEKLVMDYPTECENILLYIEDVKLQHSINKWKREASKLKDLEKKLDLLRSDDARRKDDIDSIKELLK